MIQELTISIPVELARLATTQRTLANKYQVNNFIRCIDTWLVLKAITRSGIIQDWNKQKKELLQLCKVSETIFRSRLSWLHKKNFLCYDKKNIRIASFDSLAKILEIDLSKKYSFPYKIDNKQRVQEWIIATEIQDNQQRQDYMILKRVNKNPEFKMQLTIAMINDGADRARLNKEPEYFLSRMKSLYIADFIQASDIHELLIDVRPDNNRGVKGMQRSWNTKSAQTVSYWKKILQSVGIIDISKFQVQSCERVRNINCKVIWLKKDKETLLVLPDQLTVMQPWLIKKFLIA